MKIKNMFYKIMLIILLILVIYVTYSSIFYVFDIDSVFGYYNTVIIILGVITCIYLFKRLKKLIDNTNERKINIISVILCIVFFIALSIFGSTITSIPTFDLSDIQVEVQAMLENGGKFVDEQDYFAIYKIQQPVTILIYIIYSLGKLIGADNLRVFTTIINSAFMSITAFFIYLSVKQLKDYKVAFISLLFFIINPVFYCYTSWFYTDLFSMPFATIGIYLFLLAQKQENSKKGIFTYIMSGFVLALGFNIRVVVGISLIAIIIAVILNNKFGKNVVKVIISMIIGFFIGIILCKLIMIPFNTETDRNKELPPTHWIMMGLNKAADAAWNRPDYIGSLAKTTYSEKVAFNIETIKQRLSEFKPKELIEFLKVKVDRTWVHGDYGYIYVLKNVEEINGIYEYVSGNKSMFFLYYCQIMKATIMVVFSLIILKEIFAKKPDSDYKFVYITLFGGFLFYLMWEANRRYSLLFLPILILTFGVEINQLSKINIGNIFKKNDKIKIILNKFKTILPLVVLICSIILILENYFNLTVDKRKYYDNVVVSETRNQMDTQHIKIYNNKIEQTFKTDKKFNTVSVCLVNYGTYLDKYYAIELYNSKNELLFSKIFSSYKIGREDNIIFQFQDTIVPKGEEEFTIKLYDINATEKNSLFAYVNSRKGFSIYPDGKVRINGEEKEMNLIFSVLYANERPYIGKVFYIILSSLILGVQIFAFYPYIYKNKEEKEFCN